MTKRISSVWFCLLVLVFISYGERSEAAEGVVTPEVTAMREDLERQRQADEMEQIAEFRRLEIAAADERESRVAADLISEIRYMKDVRPEAFGQAPICFAYRYKWVTDRSVYNRDRIVGGHNEISALATVPCEDIPEAMLVLPK